MTAFARRALFGSVAAAAALPTAARSDHPDRELLDVCARLRERQGRWQARWAAVPDDSKGDTPQDEDFDQFATQIWPAFDPDVEADAGGNLLARLTKLRATTPEGRQAKAAAVVAVIEALDYGPLAACDAVEECDLMRSALRDAAGEAHVPLGKDAT